MFENIHTLQYFIRKIENTYNYNVHKENIYHTFKAVENIINKIKDNAVVEIYIQNNTYINYKKVYMIKLIVHIVNELSNMPLVAFSQIEKPNISDCSIIVFDVNVCKSNYDYFLYTSQFYHELRYINHYIKHIYDKNLFNDLSDEIYSSIYNLIFNNDVTDYKNILKYLKKNNVVTIQNHISESYIYTTIIKCLEIYNYLHHREQFYSENCYDINYEKIYKNYNLEQRRLDFKIYDNVVTYYVNNIKHETNVQYFKDYLINSRPGYIRQSEKELKETYTKRAALVYNR